MSFSNIGVSVEISNSFLLKLPRVLITTILKFWLLIFNFYLKTLAKRLFSIKIFTIIFKKASRFLIKRFFKMRFRIISCYYLALDIFLISSISWSVMAWLQDLVTWFRLCVNSYVIPIWISPHPLLSTKLLTSFILKSYIPHYQLPISVVPT